MPPGLTVVGLLLVLCVAVAADGLTLFVAPDGDDAAAGTREAPLAGLAGARDRIRALRARGLDEPVTVEIAGGVYLLDETFRLTPEDSGSAAAPVVYQAADGAAPEFWGGRRITGWRRGEGPLWTAEVPAGWYFHQLWVDGRRASRARTPNEGYLRTTGQLPGFENPNEHQGDEAACRGFRFAPGDLSADWRNLEDVNLFVYFSWTSALCWIDQVDEQNQLVHFANRTGWPVGWWERNNTRYQVENCFEALDAPGEWYLDRAESRLYYYPREDEEPNQQTIVAPALQELVRIEGDPAVGLPVSHVTLRGLRFLYGDWQHPRDQMADGQSAVFLTAAVRLRSAVECRLERCTIGHVGTYGVWLDEGSQQNAVQQCEIYDLGAGGVRIGTGSSPATPAQAADGNLVDNCFIHSGGRVFPAGCGIIIQRASHNTLTHNEIADFYYTGLSIGWSWGYAETSAHDNVAEYNHVHHLGWGVLSDMGGIYTLGVSPGTRINHNLFHDILSYDYGGWGLYTDEGSTDIEMAYNVVYNTKTGGFHQHYGRDNRILNNVLAYSATHQIQRSRNEEHNSFFFERNIVLFANGVLLGGTWGNDRFTMGHNLYWDTSGQWGAEDLGEWQARGHDEGSQVADPRFVDPASHDFRLRDDSPARALGIEPIDVGEVGLYGDAEWVAKPASLHLPPMVFPAPPEPETIDDDFEQTAVGELARAARTSGEEQGASIRVSDETAASGDRSLKFTDAPGLEHEWQPHMYYALNHRRGTVTLSFAARTEPGARWYCEWRDAAQPYRVGPSLSVAPDGQLTAAGRPLLRVPQGEWFNLEMTCTLGRERTGTWQLAVTLPGQPPQVFADLPADEAFRELRWLGWSSTATERAVFYLDDLRLSAN